MNPRNHDFNLHYVQHGAGLPMIVVHGGPGFDHTYLRSFLDPFGERIQLIYFDQRESGLSRSSTPLQGASFLDLVDDIERLRVHLELERVMLFGHSFGGTLALAYAHHYASHVERLILCSATPSLDHLPESLASIVGQMSEDQKAVLAGLGQPIPSDEVYTQAYRTLLPLYFEQFQPAHEIAALGEMRCSAAAWNHLAMIMGEISAQADSYRIACPTLLMNGKQDWYMTPAQVSLLRASAPDATWVEIEGSRHLPFIEQPKNSRSALKEWLGY